MGTNSHIDIKFAFTKSKEKVFMSIQQKGSKRKIIVYKNDNYYF